MMKTAKSGRQWIRSFEEISIGDVPEVGGKNASLGEMVRELSAAGVKVPAGFAVTSAAYRLFLEKNGLTGTLKEFFQGVDLKDIRQLSVLGAKIRRLFLSGQIPDELTDAIMRAYENLSGTGKGTEIDVAVRSSATAEDLPEASFAGQQETYLNVVGRDALLESCKRCYASLFTDRAIAYREDRGIDHLSVALSIGIQKMVRSDIAVAGVMFSIDTETGFRDVVLINSSYGLGETVVQGSINPDEFMVFKPTLKSGHRPIVSRSLGGKEFKLVYDIGGGRGTKSVPVPSDERKRFSLSDDEILQLARWACVIEDHYSQPMDMEWAKDGSDGHLYVVQARPETVESRKPPEQAIRFSLKAKPEERHILVQGKRVGMQIAQGPVRVIRGVQELPLFQKGEILVAEKTDPDWVPAMKRASAVVTNRGGRTCHAAIVSRELGVPAIVGTLNGTEILQPGQKVTVSCAEGDLGFVFDGYLEFDREVVRTKALSRPKTKIMLNVAEPEQALKLSFLPNDGVGLARIEFIISNAIGIHPLALIHFDSLSDAQVRERIDRLTHGYRASEKPEFFVDRLAEGVGMIAAAFYPKDVIVRMSDFKTNEYANLLGGASFEPREENPMLGFRGASRYYDEAYRAGFALECRAMRRVREEMGLVNLKIMIPFCRTPEEGRRVIRAMEENGLKRGEEGLEIYVMCEIPSNVLMAEEFAKVFDGFSIGSNDLTQLILGVDRDSEKVSALFDERNPAVLKMIRNVIRAAKTHQRKIGICGQAPSDYPEFGGFLVENGIDSISLNADSLLAVTSRVLEVEARLGKAA